jgi:hypothetical protein
MRQGGMANTLFSHMAQYRLYTSAPGISRSAVLQTEMTSLGIVLNESEDFRKKYCLLHIAFVAQPLV